MAHHSGGGSHSGGSHHSSSHHSSGGHGGSSGPRYSSRPFSGARRYRYYDRRGRAHYLYGEAMPKSQSIISVIFSLIMIVPFLGFGVLMIFAIIQTFLPVKALPAISHPAERIEDTINVIDDEAGLEAVLQQFEDLTGIVPYILTVPDTASKNFDSYDAYALSAYYNRFDDEQHFLVVYFEPEAADDGFVDWDWEAIQGDDTDSIITEDHFSRFQNDLQKNLTRTATSTDEAFKIAFTNSLEYMMEEGPKEDMTFFIVFPIIWFAFIGFFIYSAVIGYVRGKRLYEEVPMGNSSAVPNAATNMPNQTTFSGESTIGSGPAIPGSSWMTYANDSVKNQSVAAAAPTVDELNAQLDFLKTPSAPASPTSPADSYGTTGYGNAAGSYGTAGYGNAAGSYGTAGYGNAAGSYGTTGYGNAAGGYGTENTGFNDDSRFYRDELNYNSSGYVLNGEYVDGKKGQ